MGRKCSELRVTFHRLLLSFREGYGDGCGVAVSLRAGVCGCEGTRQPGPRPRARAPWEGARHSCRQSGKNQAAWSKQPVTTGCGRKKSLFQTRTRHERRGVSWVRPREGCGRAACSGAQTPGRTEQAGQAGSNQPAWRRFGDRWSPIPCLCPWDLGSVLETQGERQKGKRGVLSTETLREQGPSTQGPMAAGGLGGAPQARGHESPALSSRDSWDTGAYLGLWVPQEGGEKPLITSSTAAFLEAPDSLGPLLPRRSPSAAPSQ